MLCEAATGPTAEKKIILPLADKKIYLCPVQGLVAPTTVFSHKLDPDMPSCFMPSSWNTFASAQATGSPGSTDPSAAGLFQVRRTCAAAGKGLDQFGIGLLKS